jgi:hypothetical protein
MSRDAFENEREDKRENDDEKQRIHENHTSFFHFTLN